MKKKILLFSLGMGAVLLTLSSYKNGPAHGGLGNRSGSGSSTNTCSNSGCHRPESTAVAISATLTDVVTGVAVTDGKYIPGKEYQVKLTGGYTGAMSFTHYGFQASVVNASNGNIGTIAATQTSTATASAGSLTVIEHTSPIPENNGAFEFSFKWTAPAAGAGTMRIFTRVLANNNNNSSNDDVPNSYNTSFTEGGATNIDRTFFDETAIKVFPNPASSELRVSIAEPNKVQSFKVIDINGKTVANQQNVVRSENKIDIERLPAGTYFLHLQHENSTKTVPFIKK